MNSLRSAWTPVLARLPDSKTQAKADSKLASHRDILSIELAQNTGQATLA